MGRTWFGKRRRKSQAGKELRDANWLEFGSNGSGGGAKRRRGFRGRIYNAEHTIGGPLAAGRPPRQPVIKLLLVNALRRISRQPDYFASVSQRVWHGPCFTLIQRRSG